MSKEFKINCGLVFMIAVVIILSIILTNPTIYGRITKPKVEAGQVWISQVENPFRDSIAKHYILEIRGDWLKYVNVKYKDHESIELFIWTDKIDWFTRGRELEK